MRPVMVNVGVTVSTKLSEALPPLPSLTVMVIVVVPVWFAAGVMVTVRLAPLPPKLMLALGTSVVLDEDPASVRLAAGVWASPTVKGIVPVPIPFKVLRSAMLLIVGGVLV